MLRYYVTIININNDILYFKIYYIVCSKLLIFRINNAMLEHRIVVKEMYNYFEKREP